MDNVQIRQDMLARFDDLNRLKKEIDQELNELKEQFNAYFDETVGVNLKGELEIDGYRLQRQIRRSERFDEKQTVERLRDLQMEDLIETVQVPDKVKIQAAIELGLLREDQVEDLIVRNYSKVIAVKKIGTL
ncbi:hypothetical protein [Oceanobacillus sp. CAU 1775]